MIQRAHIFNPLYQLIVAQCAFVLVGMAYLEFHTSLLGAATAVGAAVLTELAFARGKLFFPASAIAAGLGIAIFFRSSSLEFFALAAFLAIASKHLITLRGAHMFNPSNFGIVLCVFLFPFSTTIEFTQWGSSPWIYGAIVLIALSIAYRARALVTTASFIASYAALLVVIVPHLPLLAVHHYGIIGPSFILFASFMITDPKTSPTGLWGRIFHGITLSLTYFTLEIWGVRYTLFAASFLVSGMNAASSIGWSALRMPERMPMLPRNTLTLVIVFAVAAYVCGGTVARQRASFEVSPSFVLFGVESDALQDCRAHPAFQIQQNAGIGPGRTSNGAAWSDIDNDGYDDLFVPDKNEPSALYRNNRNGSFSNITAAVGIPALNASSAFFADYDNDGWPDLFVVASEPVGAAFSREAPSIRVFKNYAGISFKEVTGAVGLSQFTALGYRGTLSFADYNNDGYLDMLAVSPGDTLLLTSNTYAALQKSLFDPYFPRPVERVCDAKGVQALLPTLERMAHDSGDTAVLERLIAEPHVCVQVNYGLSLVGGQRVHGSSGPITSASILVPGSAHLFENRRGVFVEHPEFWKMLDQAYPTESVSIASFNDHPYDKISKVFWQPLSFDYNRDGLADIFLSVDIGTNVLLKNTGHFSFKDVTASSGIDYLGSGMGAGIGDYNGDGWPDIIVDNVNDDFLFVNNKDGTFTNRLDLKLGQAGVGWGVSFLDYNLDGKEDIYLVNGDTTKTTTDIDLLYVDALSRPLFRSDILYKNTGDGLVRSDDLCPDGLSGKALALSDYNNDGTPDAFVTNIASDVYENPGASSGNRLYENTTTGKHYLKMRLVGSTSNRMGIGAQVQVTVDGKTQTQWLTLGGSFYSEHSQALLFGLGESRGPAAVEVSWPSGKTTTLRGVQLDQTLIVRE